jgi:hypothetical protein
MSGSTSARQATVAAKDGPAQFGCRVRLPYRVGVDEVRARIRSGVRAQLANFATRVLTPGPGQELSADE